MPDEALTKIVMNELTSIQEKRKRERAELERALRKKRKGNEES